MPKPENPHYTAAAQALNNIDYKSGVNAAYGRAENQVKESGSELFGADSNPELRDRERQSRLFKLTTDKGHAMNQADQMENAARLGGNMALGAATEAPLVQTGGSYTGNMVSNTKVPYSVMDWMNLGIGGLGAGAAAF